MGDIMSEVSSKELYEFKKTLKELSQKRGRGTELVSVYIPPDKQLSDVGKHMRDELGQSANIKSKQTKKNVQSAIEVILQSIRLYKQPPENGIVLFEERFAEFKAKVIIELIRKLKIDDLSKRKILKGLIEKVNELEKNEKF